MPKIIGLDNGHGINTAGKRSPKFEDGTFMKEYEFNSAVVKYLDQYLQYNGFNTLLVSPTEDDTPLEIRTDLANNTIKNKYNKPVDIYISIHANALGNTWGNHGGIETYIYTKVDENTKRLGQIVHKNVMKNTSLKDRGLKQADFHVLRETKMPSVLCELGFMDNKQECLLLLSDAYRQECAKKICIAVCEYYNVPFKDLDLKGDDDNMEQINVKINFLGKEIKANGVSIDGTNYVSVRDLAEKVGLDVGWNNQTKTVLIKLK